MRKRNMQNRYLGMGVILVAGMAIGAVVFGGKHQESNSPSLPSSRESSSSVSPSSALDSGQDSAQVVSSVPASSQVSEEPVTDAGSSSASIISQFNNSAILAGDFTSLEGTWVNEQGRSLTFTAAGLEKSDGEIEGLEQTADGLLKGYWYKGDGGAGIIIVPAGTAIDTAGLSGNPELKDASNQQADRIWIGQDYASQSDPTTYYYKQ